MSVARKCHKRREVFLGVALALALLTPASASATTGAIEGVAVDPSLTQASVQNLSASYDQCSAEQSEELVCSWTAVAMLVPPWDSACPADGIFELLPGFPGHQLDATRVWYESASADGTLESGPLAFPLDRVDDEHLCLYINRSVESTSSASSPTPAGPLYVPLILASELVGFQLLHVDLPPGEGDQPAAPAAPPACRKHQVRRHNSCVNKRARHHGHRHRARR